MRGNVEFGLKMKGKARYSREPAARTLLGLAGLLQFENHYPERLSGGMKQRVGIVRALACTASDYYASLAVHGTTEPFRGKMLDFDGLNDLIGTPEMVALGKQYEAPIPSPDTKTGDKA